MPDFKVEDVKLGGPDSAGAEIVTVYYKSEEIYAIFGTKERVIIQYADNKDKADEQRRKFASLNPVRGEINGLIDGWRKGNDAEKSKARLFDRRVADALEYAFESDSPADALIALNAIKADVLAERTAIARAQYVVVAAMAVLILGAITCYFASPLSWIDPFFKPFWAAAGFGGMGALFSIAIGIHSRSMATDLQYRQNAVDATLRILIGGLSAFILYLLLRSSIVSLTINGVDLANISLPTEGCPPCPVGGKPPAAALLFAGMALTFLAGFAERWVGDMLNRLVDTVSANPLAGSSQNLPPVGKKQNGDEQTTGDKGASSAKDGKGESAAKDVKGASPGQDNKRESQAKPVVEGPPNADQPAADAETVAAEASAEADALNEEGGQQAQQEDGKGE